VDTVEVGPDGIRLGQLLKHAGMVESGGQAKMVLAAGTVTVNGAVETRRGAKLSAGDVVTFAHRSVWLVDR
jgi:ribosome-associated protein